MNDLRIVIPGHPVPKQRPTVETVQHARCGGNGCLECKGKGWAKKVQTGKRSRGYAVIVRSAAHQAVALASEWKSSPTDHFVLKLVAWFENPDKRGDIDNVVKAVSDGLNGIAWPDDRQVIELHAWARVDAAKPRVEVLVRRVA